MKTNHNRYFNSVITAVAVLFFLTGCKKEDAIDLKNKIADIDGNTYDTIRIGSQTWMAENLRTTHFRNGDPIPEVTGDAEWKSLTSPGYCNYDNSIAIADTYGHLYNWYAVSDERNIAPEGWHVPTINEWLILMDYLGGQNIAGGKLKERGTEHWASPNIQASNESGFTGLPGGVRMSYGDFSSLSHTGDWWAIDELTGVTSLSYYISYAHPILGPAIYLKQYGLQVRCIKD
jgi:uncharacterized protein (TIGR02145 family)